MTARGVERVEVLAFVVEDSMLVEKEMHDVASWGPSTLAQESQFQRQLAVSAENEASVSQV
jgi:hypothetical protein